jgi:hypothetical protein
VGTLCESTACVSCRPSLTQELQRHQMDVTSTVRVEGPQTHSGRRTYRVESLAAVPSIRKILDPAKSRSQRMVASTNETSRKVQRPRAGAAASQSAPNPPVSHLPDRQAKEYRCMKCDRWRVQDQLVKNSMGSWVCVGGQVATCEALLACLHTHSRGPPYMNLNIFIDF